MQGWSGSDYSKNIVVNEKDHPYTGTPYAWVRARCVGGKSTIWGRLALRLSDYDFKAASRDGFGQDWPISYKDIEPYYDKVDLYLGISGVKENLPYLPDSIFQRPTKLNYAEVKLRESLGKMGRVLTPYRAGVTTDGLKHNKYRSRCFGRGACSRRAGGCDIHAAFDSPTGLIAPAMDTGHLTLRTNSVVYEVLVDKDSGKARGVTFIDAENGQALRGQRQDGGAGGFDARVGAAAAALEVDALSQRHRQFERPCRSQFLRAHHGPGCDGAGEGSGRQAVARSTMAGPAAFYVPRFRNLSERNPNFIRGYGFEGSSGAEMFPEGRGAARFRRVVQEGRARLRRRVHRHGRVRRSVAAL